MNGCAFCLDMHADEGRKAGLDQRKLDVLAGWHEAPDLYTDRERAALEFTEEVTHIGHGGVSDRVWQQVEAQFSQVEHVRLRSEERRVGKGGSCGGLGEVYAIKKAYDKT